MAIRNPQATLDQLYAARDNLLSNAVQRYRMDDGREFTLFNLEELNREIRWMEGVVGYIQTGTIVADLSEG
jgi:hypothetical protein